MVDFTELLAKLDERSSRLYRVDQAIADIRRLCRAARKPKRSARQLRLPLLNRRKRVSRVAAA